VAKVPEGESDVLYVGDTLTIRAMRLSNGSSPAKAWADGLTKKGQGQLLAAAQIIENSLLYGRPPAGRMSKIHESKFDLLEVRVTQAGSTAPHLRLLVRREGNTLWAAHGFTKQSNQLKQSDVAAGDSVTEAWLEERE
jgi:hypothetical protein